MKIQLQALLAQLSGVAAAKYGIELSVSAPFEQGKNLPIIDPLYGQVPITVYSGFGAGLTLGVSLGLDKTTWWQQCGRQSENNL